MDNGSSSRILVFQYRVMPDFTLLTRAVDATIARIMRLVVLTHTMVSEQVWGMLYDYVYSIFHKRLANISIACLEAPILMSRRKCSLIDMRRNQKKLTEFRL